MSDLGDVLDEISECDGLEISPTEGFDKSARFSSAVQNGA